MLVVRRERSLLLVEQMEHARLAGDLSAHWGNRLFQAPRPREPVRLAAALHDKGWEEPDSLPLFNAAEGRPTHFFEVPFDDHARLYRLGVEKVTQIDPYAGLLAGMHWIGLYRQRWGTLPRSAAAAKDRDVEARVEAVVVEEERRWINLKLALWPAVGRRSEFESRLWTNYELLQVWDLLSLSLCMMPIHAAKPGSHPPVRATALLGLLEQESQHRLVGPAPTAPGAGSVDLLVSVSEPGVVMIDPYPFDRPELSLGITARTLPDRSYSTSEEMQEALENAGMTRIDFTIVPSPDGS